MTVYQKGDLYTSKKYKTIYHRDNTLIQVSGPDFSFQFVGRSGRPMDGFGHPAAFLIRTR